MVNATMTKSFSVRTILRKTDQYYPYLQRIRGSPLKMLNRSTFRLPTWIYMHTKVNRIICRKVMTEMTITEVMPRMKKSKTCNINYRQITQSPNHHITNKKGPETHSRPGPCNRIGSLINPYYPNPPKSPKLRCLHFIAIHINDIRFIKSRYFIDRNYNITATKCY